VVKSFFNKSELIEFESAYKMNEDKEENALHARGEFLERFPIATLSSLSIDDYVIGLKKPTFCTLVEVTTRFWARIQGATAAKFGIYFGRTNSDPVHKYRFTRKFGKSRNDAFAAIKGSLLDLVNEGSRRNPNFKKIDDNLLSPMFKAKILSLYFPDKFINVCSHDHLEILAGEFELPEGLYFSEYQNKLLSFKSADPITRDWSYPKYMAFLYRKFINAESEPTQKPKALPKKINLKDLQARKDARGKAAEGYAVEWEKKRLNGAGLGHLIKNIENRTDRPGYGYDFLSYSSSKTKRYIEVKSVLKIGKSGTYRFYLSKNEQVVSKSVEHRSNYYFYLVFFDGNGSPVDLYATRAIELYKKAEMDVDSFVVLFQDERP